MIKVYTLKPGLKVYLSLFIRKVIKITPISIGA